MSRDLLLPGVRRGAMTIGTAVLCVASAIAIGIATFDDDDEDPLHECWVDFKAKLQECAALAHPGQRASCFNTAVASYTNCLSQVDPEFKPADCWGFYLHLTGDCIKPGTCQTDECQAACFEAAENFHAWCIAIATDGVDSAGAQPTWFQPPESLDAWSLHDDFTISTNDPRVDSVSIWVVHASGLRGNETVASYRIGDAEMIGEFGDRRVWEHTSHRAAWEGIDELAPFGPHDRVVLIARAESDGLSIGVAHIVAQIK